MAILGMIITQVSGQELDPRAYAALPANLNAIAIQTGISKGNVLTEPSLPIKDLDITTYISGIGYVRTFGIAGKLARIQASVPFASLSGNAQINGHDTSAVRSGFGDTRIRFGINLIGSPALDKRKFTTYTQETVVGISFVASVPTGLYYADKLINIGSNRWGFKPEVGVSKRIKRIYLEAYAGMWFYTANNKYLGTHSLTQKPLGSIQGHACYYFKNKMWLSFDWNWFSGGQVFVNDMRNGNNFDNWRVGGTWSVSIARGQSLKLQFNQGALTNKGYNYTSVSLAYQYVF